MKLVKGLYEVEREATALGLDNEARRQLRLKKSAPILNEIRMWALKQLSLEPPGGEYRRACNYLIRHEAALRRFLEDGALPLDNNEAERSVRGIAQGRKSWLFAGSDAGAERYLPTTLRQVAVEFSGRGPPPPRARNPRVASPSPSSSSPPLRFAPFLRATMTRVAATKPALAG